ncbi:hypothetical protein PR048_031966 [Dryococelus australis]|uniref:Uncharacterized protein n=1 Tax=Dryococelus australis TaxID=614101 RepID=A0ABQ9G7R6_9NEOP|nr:hypothetical protein PR048_031966 [Dryococelus australis]
MTSIPRKKNYNQLFLECYTKEFPCVTCSINESNYTFCLCCACDINISSGVSMADHAGPLFRKMFRKSEGAKKHGCGRTKTVAKISEMADECQSYLADMLKTTPFSVATDGSSDESTLYPKRFTNQK